ncbi:MAG: hypothetical protein EB127_14055 [Alphaproteobacteria bacterium]|nr:hypothetical protein [Alphaproteobacteria bacterium]
MPTYSFRNKQTGEEFDEIMSISKLDQYKTDNPDLEQLLGTPPIGDPIRLGMKKPDDTFRDILKQIKKNSDGKRIRSTINTW